MKRNVFLLALVAILSITTQAQSEEDTTVVIYPILAQAPIFGADVRLPETPGGGTGGDGEEIERSTELNRDSAFLAGIAVDARKWFFEFEAVYAGLSADRESPFVKVSTDLYYFDATTGWKFYKDFALTGGVKRLALNTKVELGNNVEASTEPGFWDPMVGIALRPSSSRVQLNMSLQVGGFDAGSDLDIDGRVSVDIEFLPHIVFDAGYNFLYIRFNIDGVRVGTLQRELILEQTLHGPRVGIGIKF